MYIYIYTHARAWARMAQLSYTSRGLLERACLCVYLSLSLCIYIYICIYVYVYIYIYIYIYMCLCICVCIHIYIYIHIYIHILSNIASVVSLFDDCCRMLNFFRGNSLEAYGAPTLNYNNNNTSQKDFGCCVYSPEAGRNLLL